MIKLSIVLMVISTLFILKRIYYYFIYSSLQQPKLNYYCNITLFLSSLYKAIPKLYTQNNQILKNARNEENIRNIIDSIKLQKITSEFREVAKSKKYGLEKIKTTKSLPVNLITPTFVQVSHLYDTNWFYWSYISSQSRNDVKTEG